MYDIVLHTQPRSQGLSSLPPLSLRKRHDNGGRKERPWERGCDILWDLGIPDLAPGRSHSKESSSSVVNELNLHFVYTFCLINISHWSFIFGCERIKLAHLVSEANEKDEMNWKRASLLTSCNVSLISFSNVSNMTCADDSCLTCWMTGTQSLRALIMYWINKTKHWIINTAPLLKGHIIVLDRLQSSRVASLPYNWLKKIPPYSQPISVKIKSVVLANWDAFPVLCAGASISFDWLIWIYPSVIIG